MNTDPFLGVIAQTLPPDVLLGTHGTIPGYGTALVVFGHASIPLDAAYRHHRDCFAA